MRYLNFIFLTLILILGSCSLDKDNISEIGDSHIKAIEAEFKASATLSEEGKIVNSQERLVLDNYLNEYNRRGRGPITVKLIKKNPIIERKITSLLRKKGVVLDQIVFELSRNKNLRKNSVFFHFNGYLLKVPNCNDWSGSNGFNPKNLPHTNFGCAYNRNIGLMLSDPGDTIAPEAFGGDDPSRPSRVIQKYKSGQPTGASAPQGETGSTTQ
jgi:pilus assembly protein CpaD